jgi:signal transduction histidine kinase
MPRGVSRSRTRVDARRPAPKAVNVLVVEDSEDDVLLLMHELRRQGFEPSGQRVDSAPALADALETGRWDIVISDHNMPGFNGDEALRVVKDRAPDMPFIVVSGTRGEDQAVEVMRAGASDFIVKSRLHRLAAVVEREIAETAQRRERRRMADALEESQEQLRRSRQLEAVGRLAGGVAHDFNNLIASILTYTDIVMKNLPPGSQSRADLEEIKHAGTRAAHLTGELLAFSRQQVLKRTVIDLREAIDGIRRLLHGLVGPAVLIDVYHDPALGNIKGDLTQIEQVLMNLAANARDAMSGHGRLLIRTSNVEVPSTDVRLQPSTPGSYVRLEVTDTGEGIAPEILDKIFDPFFTTKEEGKGTGLGLAMVHGVVQQSGGSIFVESQPGQGATFTIYLPRTTESAGQAPAQ